MKVAKKKNPKTRLLISTLAAKLLGHSRTAGAGHFSAHQITLAFPAFNSLELANALSELTEKELLKQEGDYERAKYSLTDYGREGRVGVA
ncbi:MAG TPA: hypothetical protein VGN88_11745 [Phycisphaerae bacterium]|jgi:hypothetical protein